MEDCIFCTIVKGEIPSFKIYEDERIFAFADINPLSKGHTLIIPKNHAENLWEISDADLKAVHAASQKIIHALKEALNPTGVACLQLNGRGVNQVVMHYHLHLIPRLSGSPDLPVCEWEMKQGDMDDVKETADKIAAVIER